jgi:hypothetical protein
MMMKSRKAAGTTDIYCVSGYIITVKLKVISLADMTFRHFMCETQSILPDTRLLPYYIGNFDYFRLPDLFHLIK